MGKGSRVPRALFGGFVLVGVIWLLCVGIMTDNGSVAMTTLTTTSHDDFEHFTWTGRANNPDHHHSRRRRNLVFHLVSKRRVPNGPDPIHNRRAAKFRQPPGRA